MKLTFLGAAGTVTGSSTLLTTQKSKVIVDFGMFQGRESNMVQQVPFAESGIDAVVLTHAHIDHVGHLPMLVKNGFSGAVYSTAATARLAKLLLLDCAHIQKAELTWKNKKLVRAGKLPQHPKYDDQDVHDTVRLFKTVEYGEQIDIRPDIKLTFEDAGHLLGSSIAKLCVADEGEERTLVFSGDLGNDHRPLMCDPAHIKSADLVVMESTYGGRSHGEHPDTKGELFDVVRRTFERGGKVIIPAFAVGRTQELLYHLRELYEDSAFEKYSTFPVFVDSPLAVEATKLFEEYADSYFDEEAHRVMRRGEDPIKFDRVQLSVTTDDSRAINDYKGSCIIISASGMCDAGRIKHHLKYNLYNGKNSVLFVGYQAEGTLGRKLLEGARSVNIFGESVSVAAEIVKISGISAHADEPALLRWISHIQPAPRLVFLNHGNDDACRTLAQSVKEQTGVQPQLAALNTTYELDFGGGTVDADTLAVKDEQDMTLRRVDDALARLVAISGKLGYLAGTDAKGEEQKIEDALTQIEELWQTLKR